MKIGDMFIEAHSKDTYMLVSADAYRAALVNIQLGSKDSYDRGNRWNNSIWIKDPNDISVEEFRSLSNGANWTPVTNENR